MEKFKESFHIALNSLGTNPIRSILSIMGVVIGVAAVITILSIGSGIKNDIWERINMMGANSYSIYGRYDETTMRMGEFELEDIDRLSALPSVLSVRPDIQLYREIRSRKNTLKGSINGVDASYLESRGYEIKLGRNISPIEIEERAFVCLLSQYTESELFPNESAVGKSIYFEGNPWTVIGVYGSARDIESKSRDISIAAPLSTVLRNMKNISIQSLEVHIRPDAGENRTTDIIGAMEREDPKRKGLYVIRSQKESYAQSLAIQKTLSFIGTIVAGISLIVGGIGMMNVMLTSVAERTREIGIRRAVGARRKDILFQFLIESCVLSSMGGLLGLILGAAVARALPVFFRSFFTIAPILEPSFLVIAVATGVFLGMVFGFYPAIKASRLSPSEALRSE